jgi:hypothetical protein
MALSPTHPFPLLRRDDVSARTIPFLLDLCTSRHIFMSPQYFYGDVQGPLSNNNFIQILRSIELLTLQLGNMFVINLRSIYLHSYTRFNTYQSIPFIFSQPPKSNTDSNGLQASTATPESTKLEDKPAPTSMPESTTATPESTNTSLDSPQENLNPERNPLVNVSDIIAQVNITQSPVSTVVENPTNNAPIDNYEEEVYPGF